VYGRRRCYINCYVEVLKTFPIIWTRMTCLRVFLVITLIGLVFADDLQGNLTSAGISAVFPGDSEYSSASTACM
jgi:hypothetical protein